MNWLIFLFCFPSFISACVALRSISPEELAGVPKSLQMHYRREGKNFSFTTQGGKANFSIDLMQEQWEKLPKRLQSKCRKTEKGYTYGVVNPHDPEGEYCIANRRIMEKAKPNALDCKQLADWIKTKNVVFYTGAGISSAAGVPTMHQLDVLFEFDQNWIEKAIRNPKKILRSVQHFHRACYETFPTQAHYSLKNIALEKNLPILTENLDHLHHKTGIKPFCVTAQAVKEEILEDNLQKVDAIICIGLSFDDKGFLGWYKELQPKGKIISIDLEQPSYLGNEDFLLTGDIQEVLPKLELMLRKNSPSGAERK